jgi:hypothetical protein
MNSIPGIPKKEIKKKSWPRHSGANPMISALRKSGGS